MSGYKNSAQPTFTWCERCLCFHEHWEGWEETMWFMEYKMLMRMQEAFDEYLEDKVMEMVDERRRIRRTQ